MFYFYLFATVIDPWNLGNKILSAISRNWYLSQISSLTFACQQHKKPKKQNLIKCWQMLQANIKFKWFIPMLYVLYAIELGLSFQFHQNLDHNVIWGLVLVLFLLPFNYITYFSDFFDFLFCTRMINTKLNYLYLINLWFFRKYFHLPLANKIHWI